MKNNEIFRVLLGGDVFGPVGMRVATALLPGFIAAEEIDFCVLNGENASLGIGVSADDARSLLAAGADVITGGNHTFEKRDFWPVLDDFAEVLRPANFPSLGGDNRLPGRGAAVYGKGGASVAVLNLQGREEMTAIDCPFRAADAQLAAWNDECPGAIVVVDFHAESNQEKEALGLYLAGRVASVTGTHTHVQTADERLLSGGTAYMTDLGMTGAIRSVIGGDPEFAIKRNVTQVLYRMEAVETRGALRGLIVDVDRNTRLAVDVRRVDLPERE